ncbi:MAG: hypothetical protein AAB895_02575, partial [Patescibacteria group bacterium]
IVIVLIIIIGLAMSKKNKDVLVEETPIVDNTVQPGTNTPTDSPAGAVANPDREGTSVGSGAGKYATLMLTYKGRMIQFNKECAVITNKQGFKQGTDILLDNRDDTAVKIVIGSRTFNLPAYGYKVIDLPTIGSFQLDCNKRLNVVTVTVQK